jgi:hypothetical protein
MEAMKRTERSWNSTLPPASEPMRRSGPIKAKGKPRHAVSGVRDEPYREYIRSLPCLVAGKPGHTCRGVTECAHVRSKGAGGADRGNTIPLCSRAHGEQHSMGIRSFAAATGLDLKAEALRLECAFVLRDFQPDATAVLRHQEG